MQDFITLDRTHPEFNSHLLGGRHPEKIALPVKTLYVNRGTEEVTFQIFNRDEIQRPKWPIVLMQLFRLELLPLTFVPAVVTVVSQWSETNNTVGLIFSFICLFLLHAATFCRNDYVDHMKGIDRVNEKSGSQIIQKGWLRASSVRNIYWLLFALAGFSAIPIFYNQSELVLLGLAVWLLGTLGYSHLRWGAVPWIFGDLAILLCLGVFLTGGMSWVAVGRVPSEVLYYGVFFGLIAVMYVETRHMMSLMVDYEARLMTLPVRLGFDRAKMALIGIVLANLIIFVVLVTSLATDLKSLLGLPLVAYLTFLAKNYYSLKSPLSSTLQGMPRAILYLYGLSGVFFVTLYIL